MAAAAVLAAVLAAPAAVAITLAAEAITMAETSLHAAPMGEAVAAAARATKHGLLKVVEDRLLRSRDYR